LPAASGQNSEFTWLFAYSFRDRIRNPTGDQQKLIRIAIKGFGQADDEVGGWRIAERETLTFDFAEVRKADADNRGELTEAVALGLAEVSDLLAEGFHQVFARACGVPVLANWQLSVLAD
jgi:hypothetical protein